MIRTDLDQVAHAVREPGEKNYRMDRMQGRNPGGAFRSARAAVALAALAAIPAGLAAQGKLAPIPIQLPKPMFEGTPQNVRGIANLQKPLNVTDFATPRPEFAAVMVKPSESPALTGVASATFVSVRFEHSTVVAAVASIGGVLDASAVAVFG